MFKNRKIKEAIKEATKPEIQFEEFCMLNNIILNEKIRTKQPGRLTTAKRTLIPIASVLILLLGVILPLLLVFDSSTEPDPLPETKVYGETDVESTRIAIDDLLSLDSLKIFDCNNVEQMGFVNEIYPIENSELLLGYRISDVIYGFFIEEELFAFQFDVIIRCYDSYNFAQLVFFKDFKDAIIHNTITFEYCLYENEINTIAYITFSIDSYDYYIVLKDYQDLTEISHNTIELFLKNAY